MSETDALRALMEADRWVDRVVQQRSHLPELATLADTEEALRALALALREAQAALEPVDAAYRDARNESERLTKRADELARALETSTAGARDLGAMQRELEHLRAVLSESEERELTMLLALEPLQATVKGIREQAQPIAERRAALQVTIGELQASLDDELVALRRDRDERARAVEPSLLRRYDAALVRVGTAGAAQVVDGRCDGCRLALAPADVNRWKSQPAGTFMECPECGRLLLPC